MLVARLSAANAGTGSWEGNWRLAGVNGPRFVVTRDGLRMVLGRDLCRFDSAEPAVGDLGAVRTPSESLRASPGFYLALGNREPAPKRGPLVRFYWNVEPERGPFLVRQITRRLNEAACPFRFKVVDHRPAPPRCDAAVLYLDEGDAREHLAAICDIYRHARSFLRDGTPAFTRPLAPGLAIASDPGRGQSFGSHRCGLVAEGLTRAWEGGEGHPAGRIAAVERCLAQAGVDMARPHDLEREASRLLAAARVRSMPSHPMRARATPADCLAGAARIRGAVRLGHPARGPLHLAHSGG
jgi:hypothetical protein